LFILHDSAVSTTVSSLESGSGEVRDLDDLATTGVTGSVFTCSALPHSLLFVANHLSSKKNDSSEDISGLGGGRFVLLGRSKF
jgi:hypothetical protein